MRRRALRWLLPAAALTLAVVARAVAPADRFDHLKHAKLFPTCQSCHVGAAEPGKSFWPDSVQCAACHDGTIQRRVDWHPPAEPPATNLRFTHPAHRSALERAGRDTLPACEQCHTDVGTPRMEVHLASVGRCLDCHGVRTAHLEAPDTACATCHLPLARAARLSAADVGRFPTPPSHQVPGFATEGHGKLATAGPGPVAASCATCHARNFCLTCHVNAPEQPAIQALESDPRSVAFTAKLEEPASHHQAGFLEGHGPLARSSGATCATCHTQQSCLTCHVGSEPKQVRAMPVAGPGRGTGAVTVRRRPPSHGADFTDIHAEPASARPQACATCHTRESCLSCHRPDPSRASLGTGYHPSGFLARHPAAAYSRQTQCADCHNTRAFCQTCHVQAGVTANGRLRGGFHDAQPNFIVGHGQAARQSLESCVSCHAERDCLTCHSATGGRRFNPHGPGFDAERLKRKNPEMCTVCHGTAIP